MHTYEDAMALARKRAGIREVEWPEPPKFDRPLVFGDKEQIQKLKEFSDRVDNAKAALLLCEQCDGEGTIECPECEGSGER